MIRWEFWVGLLLSISLNIVILLWGVGLFSKQDALFLSQSAGSESAVSVMTIDLMESQSGSLEDRVTGEKPQEYPEENLQENPVNLLDMALKTAPDSELNQYDLQEVADLMVAKEESADQSVRDSHQAVTVISSSTANKDFHFQQPPIVESDLESITPETQNKTSMASDNVDVLFNRISKASTQKTLPITEGKASAQDSPKKIEPRPRNHEITDQPSTRKGNVADQQASATRSGDQFAADIAVSIQSQIQGCYPEASKRRGEEGIVYLKISKQGGEVVVTLMQSSGFSRLDRCAISAVQKSLIKITPEKIPDVGIDLKPIRFQLHNE